MSEQTDMEIGVSLPTLDDPLMRKLANALEAAASRVGYKLRAVSADRQPEKQAAQLDAFVAAAAAAVVVWPCDCEAVRARLAQAGAADIPVFTLGAACPGAEQCVVAHLAADERGGAREAARVLVDALARKGKVAILSHPESPSALERVEVFREQLALYPDMSLACVVDGGGSREKSRVATLRLLAESPPLDAIFAADEIAALGAKDAARRAGKTARVKIMAFGGVREIRQAVKQGELYGTILRDPDRLGKKVVEAITRYLAGEDVSPRTLVPCRAYLRPDAEVDTTLIE